MSKKDQLQYSRRENQIMEIVYQLGKATVSDVLKHLPDPPSYSAVRATMGQLEEKGHLKHKEAGPRHVYSPTLPRKQAQQSMLTRIVRTFFGGSTEQAVAALLTLPSAKLSEEELERLSELVEKAKKEGR